MLNDAKIKLNAPFHFQLFTSNYISINNIWLYQSSWVLPLNADSCVKKIPLVNLWFFCVFQIFVNYFYPIVIPLWACTIFLKFFLLVLQIVQSYMLHLSTLQFVCILVVSYFFQFFHYFPCAPIKYSNISCCSTFGLHRPGWQFKDDYCFWTLFLCYVCFSAKFFTYIQGYLIWF